MCKRVCVCVQQNLMKTQGETEKSSNIEGTLTTPLSVTGRSIRNERGMDTGEGEREKGEVEGRREGERICSGKIQRILVI